MEDNSKIAKEKLLILYIIKKSNSIISYEILENIILDYEIINYFDFNQYYSELKDTRFLEIEENSIKLTDFAIDVLEMMENLIDIDKKEEVDRLFSTEFPDEYKEFQVKKFDDKYIVNLKVSKDLDEDFLVTVYIDNKKDLENLEDLWLNKNKSLYIQIKNILELK